MSAAASPRPPFWYRPGVYVVLLLVLVLVHGAAFRATQRRHEPSSATTMATRLAEVEHRLSRENVLRVLPQHRGLLFMLSLLTTAAIGLFCVGLGLAIRWLAQWHRWQAFLATSRGRWPSTWSLGDLGRVAILILWWITVFPLVEAGYTWLLGLPSRARGSPGLLIASTYVSLLFVAMVYWLARAKRADAASVMGLRPAPRPRVVWRAWRSYLTAVPLLVGLLVLAARIATASGYEPPPHPLSLFFFEDQPLAWLCYGVVFTCLVAPMVEEILFRGVLFPALRSHLPFWQAAGLSGLLFGALHANWISFVPIAWLGFLLAYLYETTGSLYASIAVHALHNGIMVLLVLVYRVIAHTVGQ